MAESKEKAFYYLQISDGFFQDKVIKRLRRLPGGDTYVIIAIKILMLGLQDENHIFYDGVGDSFADEVALSIDEDTESTTMVMNLMISCGWLEQISDHEMYSPKSAEMVGLITSAGMRKRRQREREREASSDSKNLIPESSNIETEEKTETIVSVATGESDPSHNDVTPVSQDYHDTVTDESQSSHVELELEIELERKKEPPSGGKKESGKRFLAPSPEIVQAYLDELGVKSFDGQGFCDHYESKGWMVGKNRMKDWKASVRTWMRQDRERGIDPLAEVSRQKGAGASWQARGPAGLRDFDGQFDGDEPRRAD